MILMAQKIGGSKENWVTKNVFIQLFYLCISENNILSHTCVPDYVPKNACASVFARSFIL